MISTKTLPAPEAKSEFYKKRGYNRSMAMKLRVIGYFVFVCLLSAEENHSKIFLGDNPKGEAVTRQRAELTLRLKASKKDYGLAMETSFEMALQDIFAPFDKEVKNVSCVPSDTHEGEYTIQYPSNKPAGNGTFYPIKDVVWKNDFVQQVYANATKDLVNTRKIVFESGEVSDRERTTEPKITTKIEGNLRSGTSTIHPVAALDYEGRLNGGTLRYYRKEIDRIGSPMQSNIKPESIKAFCEGLKAIYTAHNKQPIDGKYSIAGIKPGEEDQIYVSPTKGRVDYRKSFLLTLE